MTIGGYESNDRSREDNHQEGGKTAVAVHLHALRHLSDRPREPELRGPDDEPRPRPHAIYLRPWSFNFLHRLFHLRSAEQFDAGSIWRADMDYAHHDFVGPRISRDGV